MQALKRIFQWTLPFVVATLLGGSVWAEFTAPTKDTAAQAKDTVKVLMLGDTGHHQPASLFRAIQKPMANLGVDIVYSDDTDATLKDRKSVV